MVCPYCGSPAAAGAQKCGACHEWIDLENPPPWAPDVAALWQVVFDYARNQKAAGGGAADMSGLGQAVYSAVTQMAGQGKAPPWLGRLP